MVLRSRSAQTTWLSPLNEANCQRPHHTRDNIEAYSRRCEAGVGLEDGPITPLPPDFSDEASTNLEDLARRVWAIGVAHGSDEGRDVFGLQCIVLKSERSRACEDIRTYV